MDKFKKWLVNVFGIETYEDDAIKYKQLYEEVMKDNRMMLAIMDTYKRDLELLQLKIDRLEVPTYDTYSTSDFEISFDDMEELVVEDED